ncbi:hypothetical protein BDF14DRAFT_1725814 [Spinellus fusiger]|nr:hypothetical protein BDF14DRAFT_1725814 [Spinellus fusiger]
MSKPPAIAPLPDSFLGFLPNRNTHPTALPPLSTHSTTNTANSANTTALPHLPSIVPLNTSLLSTVITSPHHAQRPLLQRNVPAFLNKLYNMVNDPDSDELIQWTDDGRSFLVIRHEEFAKRVLPRFFKHSNFSSFVRQLNMYGFHKVPHMQQGVLQADTESERWEFSSPHFQRNQPDLLLLVTRKKGKDSEDTKDAPTVDLHHIMDEISAIKKHQMDISAQLNTIQRDNQFLWKKTMSAREQHQRHQETIDKILRFLASVFSNEKTMTIPKKRRYLLGDSHTDYSKEEALESGDESEEEEEGEGELEKAEPTKKKPCRHASPTFDLNDYVDTHGDGREHDSLMATLPPLFSPSLDVLHTSPLTDPSNELADAIALNDISKQGKSWVCVARRHQG